MTDETIDWQARAEAAEANYASEAIKASTEAFGRMAAEEEKLALNNRIAALTEALSEVLAEYDRQMAAESWRSSRGVGYAEVQITTQEADAFRAAMKVEEPTDG